MDNLEQRIQKIEERNRKVEGDKAWETSWARRMVLTFFTYLIVGGYLQAIAVSRPWLNAIVPAVAFMISTLALPLFKHVWTNRHFNEEVPVDLIREKEELKLENLSKLRSFIRGKERITNDEAERLLRVSNATAERYLNELEREDLLEQIGTVGKGVFYKVKSSEN